MEREGERERATEGLASYWCEKSDNWGKEKNMEREGEGRMEG